MSATQTSTVAHLARRSRSLFRVCLTVFFLFLVCVACVQPNCKTDIIENHGWKKIVVLATRPIAKDEEITYNYFFASENEKIRCNCGAINCPGRLN